MQDLLEQLRIYQQKSRFLSPHAGPWTRLRVQWEFMRRVSYVQWPLYGHVLQALKEGRLEIGTGVTFLAGCWLSLPGDARISVGRNVWVNGNVMLHAYDLIEIGDFTAISRGSIVTDATHRVDVPDRPFIPQSMIVKGPTRIGSNVWIGHNVAILGGVTIGDRAIVGANSVVTRDVEPGTAVGGIPARIIDPKTARRGDAPDDRGDQAGAL